MKKRVDLILSKNNYCALADCSTNTFRSVSSIVSLCLCCLENTITKKEDVGICVYLPNGESYRVGVRTHINLSSTASVKLEAIRNSGRFTIKSPDLIDLPLNNTNIINACISYYRGSFTKDGGILWLLIKNDEAKKSRYRIWHNKIEEERQKKLATLRGSKLL